MKLDKLLDLLFPIGHKCSIFKNTLTGYAQTELGEVSLIGTLNSAELDAEMTLKLSAHVLQTVRKHPGCPVIILVDTKGHKTGRQQELLGLNSYLGHLIKVLHLARTRTHKLITIVYGAGWAGGFLALGLIGDQIYGLDTAQIGEMALPAMARVTKIPEEKLRELSKSSPIFAPGVKNFEALGVLNEIWNTDNLSDKLTKALKVKEKRDIRSELGYKRKGRILAGPVAKRVLNEHSILVKKPGAAKTT